MIDVWEFMFEWLLENENLIGILDVKFGVCILYFFSGLGIYLSVVMCLIIFYWV